MVKLRIGDTVFHRDNGNEGVIAGFRQDGKISVRWKLATGLYETKSRVQTAKYLEKARSRERRLIKEYANYTAEVNRYAVALNLEPESVALILNEERAKKGLPHVEYKKADDLAGDIRLH